MVVKDNDVKFAEYTALCRKAADDTKKTMKPPKGLVNPELDHIVPINFGYAHRIPWQVISKPENFIWIDRKENRRKGDDLTESGRKLLVEWFEQKIIDRPIGQDLKEKSDFDFSKIIELLTEDDDIVTAKIPLVTANRFAVQGIGIALTVISIWFLGAASNEEKWEQRVKELQEQVSVAENKGKQVTVEVQEKIVEKTKVIKEKGEVITKFVDKIIQGPEVVKEVTKDLSEDQKKKLEGEIEELKRVIKECPVPAVILNMHNEAAKSPATGDKK